MDYKGPEGIRGIKGIPHLYPIIKQARGKQRAFSLPRYILSSNKCGACFRGRKDSEANILHKQGPS